MPETMQGDLPRDPRLVEIAPEDVSNPIGSVFERLRLRVIQGHDRLHQFKVDRYKAVALRLGTPEGDLLAFQVNIRPL